METFDTLRERMLLLALSIHCVGVGVRTSFQLALKINTTARVFSFLIMP